MRVSDGDGQLNSEQIHAQYPVYLVILSIALGFVVIYAGQKGIKWQVVLFLLSVGTLIALFLKSVTKSIVAFLILSISMNVKFNPLYTDSYMEIHPGIPITLSGLCIVALYILWVIHCLKARPKRVRFVPSVMVPFILLVLWAGVSAIFSYQPEWTMYALPDVIQSVLLLIYMANFLRSDEDISFIVGCLAISVAITGALGLLQHFIGSSFDLKIFGGAP